MDQTKKELYDELIKQMEKELNDFVKCNVKTVDEMVFASKMKDVLDEVKAFPEEKVQSFSKNQLNILLHEGNLLGTMVHKGKKTAEEYMKSLCLEAYDTDKLLNMLEEDIISRTYEYKHDTEDKAVKDYLMWECADQIRSFEDFAKSPLSDEDKAYLVGRVGDKEWVKEVEEVLMEKAYESIKDALEEVLRAPKEDKKKEDKKKKDLSETMESLLCCVFME